MADCKSDKANAFMTISYRTVVLTLLALLSFFTTRMVNTLDGVVSSVNTLTVSVARMEGRLDRAENDIAKLWERGGKPN